VLRGRRLFETVTVANRCVRSAVSLQSRGCVAGRAKPVRAPLPCIANHGIQTELVCWKRCHGASAGIPILGCVLTRKVALPHITQVSASWSEFIAPRKELLLETASRTILPLLFCWQAPLRALGEGKRVIRAHMHYRRVQTIIDVRKMYPRGHSSRRPAPFFHQGARSTRHSSSLSTA
jgi:hypothetical protein